MGKRQFREHVAVSRGAACPRQDQIEDRRAFIAALGGVIVGAALGQGCGDDEKPAGPKDSMGIVVDINAPKDMTPHPETSGGLPDGPLAPRDTAGVPDMPQTPMDAGPPPADLPGGLPDLPAVKDQQPQKKEMLPAGLPPMPDT